MKTSLQQRQPRQLHGMRPWVISLVALGFGLLTLKEGGTVLFGDDTARAAAGHYVPFVLWSNFVAGFAYVLAGVGFWLRQRWAPALALAIAAASALTLAALGVHVYSDGVYEPRTAIAMTLRTLVWGVIAVMAWRLPATVAPQPAPPAR